MTFYGDDGIFEKAINWFMERIFIPLMILMMAILIFGGLTWGAWAGFQYWNGPVKHIELPAEQWACSKTVELWQPPYSCGGKIRSTCGGYNYTACRQWTHRAAL